MRVLIGTQCSGELGVATYTFSGMADLALCDTCCARSVAGEAWLTKFMMCLWKRGSPCYAIAENQTFRSGAGPKKESKMPVLLPTCVESQGRIMFLRVSMVEDDVPLLLSHRALN